MSNSGGIQEAGRRGRGGAQVSQGRKGRGEGSCLGLDPNRTPAGLALRAWYFLICDIFTLACPESGDSFLETGPGLPI